MSDTRIFQKRIDNQLFLRVDNIYRSLGTNVGDAFVMFLKKSEEVQGLPFELRRPSRTEMEKQIIEMLDAKLPTKKLDFSKHEDIEEFFDEEY